MGLSHADTIGRRIILGLWTFVRLDKSRVSMGFDVFR